MITVNQNVALNDGEWVAIPRISRIVPFGYQLDPENPDRLLPIVFELEALKKAKSYARTHSMRSVAEWLSGVTGRYISHVGLRKRLQVENTRRRRVATLKNWSRRLEEVQAKIEKYEAQSTGATTNNSGTT